MAKRDRRYERRRRKHPGFWRRHRVEVRAVLIFVFGLISLLALYFALSDTVALGYVRGFTGRGTSLFLKMLGGSPQLTGVTLASENFEMSIVNECTAILPVIILLCAIVAYPCPLPKKAIGAGLGILVLLALNFIRTASLFLIGSFSPNFLDAAHYLVWQPLMILMAVIFWLVWLEKVVHARRV